MTAATVSPVRIEAAINKIVRVQARLAALDHHYKTVNQAAGFLPSEQRLLREAVDLLNPEGEDRTPSAATGHRYDLRPMTTPDPGREPMPEDYDGTEGKDYLAAYNAWRERWEPWMRERKERGYV